MVNAEVRTIGANLLGGDGQLERLDQRVRCGTHLRRRRLRPVPEGQEADLLHMTDPARSPRGHAAEARRPALVRRLRGNSTPELEKSEGGAPARPVLQLCL